MNNILLLIWYSDVQYSNGGLVFSLSLEANLPETKSYFEKHLKYLGNLKKKL